MPIIRTFAPFVAGIGQMSYKRFLIYNIVGSVAWVLTFMIGGIHLGIYSRGEKFYPGLYSASFSFHLYRDYCFLRQHKAQ
jgi:membrane protein DedA with SNARE-associated domain